jgi:plastocyanin
MSRSDGQYPALSRRDLLVLIALAVVHFLVLHGPVWLQHRDWDRSIFYSYAPIPLLVLIAIRLRGRVRVTAWLIHTLEVVCAKFVITALVIIGLLLTREGLTPTAAPPNVSRPTTGDLAPAPRAAPRDGPSGELSGRVVSADGAPVAGAWVYLAAGADHWAPRNPVAVQISQGREGFQPSHAVTGVGRTVRFHSSDGALHTLRAARANGTWVFNLAVIPNGNKNELTFTHPEGELQLRCMLHGKAEGIGSLLVLPSAVFAKTDEAGHFDLGAVPAGTLSVAAQVDGQLRGSLEIHVQANSRREVELRL